MVACFVDIYAEIVCQAFFTLKCVVLPDEGIIFTDIVCLIYMGVFMTRDNLQKYIERHVNIGVFKQRFQYQDPYCSVWIDGLVHF